MIFGKCHHEIFKEACIRLVEVGGVELNPISQTMTAVRKAYPHALAKGLSH